MKNHPHYDERLALAVRQNEVNRRRDLAKEAAAMLLLDAALWPLYPDARKRVIRWMLDKYGIQL